MDEATTLRAAIERGVGSLHEALIGIGLSLSYHLVLALGGDIHYSSKPGLTKFWFSLPQEHETLALSFEPPCVMSTSHERIADVILTGHEQIATPNMKFPSKTANAIHTCTERIPRPDIKYFQQDPDAPVPVQASRKRRCSSSQEEEADGRQTKFFRELYITPVPVPMQSIASSGLQAMNPPSILVVEDTAMCAKLLCTTLTKVQSSTTWVQNGQEAVDLLRASAPDMYNLIVMDLRMPVMDGLTATAIIKKELKINTPVIALTGDTSQDVKSQCEAIGFSEFCGKPMTRAQLLNIVEKYTGYRCVTK
jgi:CheY-like chemotaxis protein